MDEKIAFEKFTTWASKQRVSLSDLFPSVKKNELFHIDLSVNNATVQTEAEFNNPIFFQSRLQEIQKHYPNKIIAGGYLEKRALYTSDIYNTKNSSEKRNMHLGVDFWLPKETPVHAILDGEVVCAIHQKDLKGYGGFIILKHQYENGYFFTLYGHLSKESIQNISIGIIIKQNEHIGVLGNYEENGNWVPHLHFQVLLSLLGYTDDFPGVALESEIEYWKNICPNPNILFQF